MLRLLYLYRFHVQCNINSRASSIYLVGSVSQLYVSSTYWHVLRCFDWQGGKLICVCMWEVGATLREILITLRLFCCSNGSSVSCAFAFKNFSKRLVSDPVEECSGASSERNGGGEGNEWRYENKRL